MDFSNIKNKQIALNAYSLRNETINKNLANVNTPNYKREIVSFEEHLDKSRIKYIDGFKTNITFIKHPSSYFTWSDWYEYLSTRNGQAIINLRETIKAQKC